MVKLATLLPLALACSVALHGQANRAVAFPSLSDQGLTGAPIPDLAGKVVLVDFCASWCAPCRASFPAYNRLLEEFGPKGFMVVGVSVDTDPAAYAAMLRKLHPSFVVLNDPQHKLVSLVQVPGMPTSYLIDRAGKVAGVRIGFHSGDTENELRRAIARLVAEPL
ncbi:MAG TPA: TlpA disulfide reductase family protein [Opitutaceae bacterium]|jgi:thiol-disulfide isomerase/thioredoxin|nr:TlpA disulfide reductase family protein [Opitutaceae bacterium]